jgi:hypothetical protein
MLKQTVLTESHEHVINYYRYRELSSSFRFIIFFFSNEKFSRQMIKWID